MPGGKLLLTALLLAAQPIGPESDSFPCEALGDAEGLRIFDGIGPAEAAPVGQVRLKEGARLARLTFPLTARVSTFDDQALATDGGTAPAMSFRSYLINGRPRLCTTTLRESVFGPANADGDFLLRCLLDRDGDGRFESFLAYADAARFNRFTRRAEEPSNGLPQVRPLPKPVRLIEHRPQDRKADLVPRVVEDVRIAGVTADRMILASRAWVAMGQGSERALGSGGKGPAVDVPLREGIWTSSGGARLQLSREGKNWLALPLEPGRSSARLQCGGAVVVTGTDYTIMTETGMSVVTRAGSSPPR